MHGYGFDGWDWLWMTIMRTLWVVALGIVVYAAVRLALGERDKTSRS